MHLCIVLMHIRNPQPCLIQQVLIFLSSSLNTSKGNHHRHVQVCSLPRYTHVWQDYFVNYNARISTQRPNSCLQDLDTLLVWPVMEHMAKIVKLRTPNWLRLEEVMRGKLNTGNRCGTCQCLGDILHDDASGDIGVPVPKCDGLLPETASYVYEDMLLRAWSKRFDFLLYWVRVDPMVHALQRHKLPKTNHVLRMLRHPLKESQFCVESLLENRIVIGYDVSVLSLFEKVGECLCRGARDVESEEMVNSISMYPEFDSQLSFGSSCCE